VTVAGGVAHLPVRMSLGDLILVDQRVIGDRDDSGVGESGDGFAEEIAPGGSGVPVADASGIVAVAVMVARIDHRALHAGESDHPHILRRVEPAHILRFPVGDMVVDQNS